MNIAYLTRMVMREYDSIVEQYPSFPYSCKEIAEVFSEFFRQYEAYRGETHPPIKREQLRKYMLAMPFDDGGMRPYADIDSEYYPEIIKAYFETRFDNCDYHIGHFFSGDIRLLRLYEQMYE